MKKNNTICITLVILAGMFYGIHTVFADVTVHSGSTLTINSATLDMNCTDVVVADGATLDLGSGVIDKLGDLLVDPQGTFIEGFGTINLCSASGQGVGAVDSESNGVTGERSSGTGVGCFINAMHHSYK